MIRHYKVPSQDVTDGVREEIAGDAVWHSATASEVMNWTSLAYFFATEGGTATMCPWACWGKQGRYGYRVVDQSERLKDFPRLLVDEEAVRKVKESRQDKGSGRWNQKISMIRIGLRRKCRVRGMSARYPDERFRMVPQDFRFAFFHGGAARTDLYGTYGRR